MASVFQGSSYFCERSDGGFKARRHDLILRLPSERLFERVVRRFYDANARHSIYQKLAPLPAELGNSWGFPNQSELHGTWPVREEVIPLCDIKVRCRVPGIRKATLQPESLALPRRCLIHDRLVAAKRHP
jgi:hypothetical protein